MAYYECPFQVGDMVIPVKPQTALRDPAGPMRWIIQPETPTSFATLHKV